MKSSNFKSYTFDKGGWVLFGSLSIAAIAILYLVIQSLFYLFDSFSINKVESLLLSRKYEDVEETLKNIGDSHPLFELFGIKEDSHPQYVKQSLAGIISTIREFHKAAPEITAQRISIISERLDANGALSPLVKESLSHIQRIALSIGEKTVRLSELERRYKTMQEVATSVENDFDLLSRDVSDLFSLDRAHENLEEIAQPFYTSGILAGLPKLEDLPDGITDPLELKSTLMKLHGEVRISGPDAPNQFRIAVNQLQEASSQLSKQWEETTTTLDSLGQQLKELRAEISQEKINLEKQLQQALLTVITETKSIL